MKMKCFVVFLVLFPLVLNGQPHHHGQVLVLTEGQGQHKPMSDAAIKWLVDESVTLDFSLQVMRSPNYLDRPGALDEFDLIIQLDYPPYAWNEGAARNFVQYIEEGRGGWIGFHHASLLGEFDGFPMWEWFSNFLGGIRYQNYIADLADGVLEIEAREHPIMEGVPASFIIPDDEWYIYDRSPREAVEVLASVDEDSYCPASEIRMGDHPVVWTNPRVKARNVYFQIGHSPLLYSNPHFTRMLHNALVWMLGEADASPR